jgi:two-component system cell cycle sensor histidine kinase/response regulator CckA
MADRSGPRAPLQYETLFDQSPAPTVVVQDGVLRYVNRAFARLYGAAAAEIEGRLFVDIIDAHDRGHVTEHLEALHRGGADAHRLQVRLRRSSGSDLWVYVTCAAIEHGGRPAAIATAVEVRERRHAQEAVSRSQRLDAVARLAGGIAHQFNNALQVIVGHAERVLTAVPESHPVHASATEIKRSAERAAVLTDRLLSFGQRQVLDPKPLDVSRFIMDVRASIERRVGPSVAVVVRRGKWTAPARVDRERFVHALAALVDHARGAMPAGGQLTIATDLVTIDAAARLERPWLRDGSYVQLLVEDSGPGLDAEAAAHVFEPFYDRPARDAEDGFGLASVYGLVKQSQGFVWVEPGTSGASGGGTRVVVLLPMDGPPKLSSDAAVAAPARTAPAGPPRVVVVEDESSVRELLTHALEKNGFRVHAFGSAEEAAEVPPASYDVLLTDISLPGMTGVELARRVRGQVPDARILLMSGFAREEYLTPADDLPFIGKPFTSRAIVERLRAILAEPAMATPAGRPN